MEHRFEMVSLKKQKQSCRLVGWRHDKPAIPASFWLKWMACHLSVKTGTTGRQLLSRLQWPRVLRRWVAWAVGCCGFQTLGHWPGEDREAGEGGNSSDRACRLLGWLRQHLLPPPSRLRWGRRSSSGNTQEWQRRNLRERKSWEDNVGRSVVGGEGEKRGEVDPRRGLRKRSSWIPSGISFARPFHRSHGGAERKERKRGKGKQASRRSGDMDKVGYPRKARARIPLGFFIAAPTGRGTTRQECWWG